MNKSTKPIKDKKQNSAKPNEIGLVKKHSNYITIVTNKSKEEVLKI